MIQKLKEFIDTTYKIIIIVFLLLTVVVINAISLYQTKNQVFKRVSNSHASELVNTHKFLGNTNIGYYGDYGTFTNYWNQITPDSSGKWGEIEPVRGNFDWTRTDQMYTYARAHNFSIKQHTFVWGIQEPSWIGGLSSNEQKIAVENWIATYCNRYPNTEFIDVVNEPLPTHQPPSYKNSIGGDGITGWDWVIWSYQKARQYCPNSKLLINEYGTIRDSTWRAQYKQIIQLLKDRNLIDGIGLQFYTEELSNTTLAGVKTALDEYWNMGIPIYISELSISNASDAQQLTMYQQYFSTFWNHPGVFGVTIWGYREGHIYEPNAFLLHSDGVAPRPALTWILNYVNSNQVTSTPIPLTSTPIPTSVPTITPTRIPTLIPTRIPTLIPSPTKMPTLYPTSIPLPTSTLVPTKTPTPIPSPTSIPVSSTVTVYAAGSPACGTYPTMVLNVNGHDVLTAFNVIGDPITRTFKTYSYNSPVAITHNQVKVKYINDNQGKCFNILRQKEDRNLRVQKININGVNYFSIADNVYSTGTWSRSKCSPGFKKSEWLHCNGEFRY